MKIAYCIPALYYPSGMERVLTLKANYFAEVFGYEIHIILTDGKDKKPYYELHPSITLHQLDIDYDELNGMSFYKKLPKYIAKQGRFKKKLNECLPAFLRTIVSNYWREQLYRQLRQLKRFIVLSHEDAQEWTELDNVEVIHNPLPFFPDQISDNSHKQVIAVGRYVPQKGFDRLIPAWQLVARKHPDWILRIYGDGMREQLQQQIDSLGITASCILEPTVSNIVDKYCESSIFALSSRFEGFGMVIIEAMACGVPPVSFTCPCGPRDIISDGKDGLLVEDGNIEQLAEKISYLIENEDIRKKMGQQARMDVQRFRIENIAEQWKQLFESLIIPVNENK